MVDVVDCPACRRPPASPGHGASAAEAVPGAVEADGQHDTQLNGKIYPALSKCEYKKLGVKKSPVLDVSKNIRGDKEAESRMLRSQRLMDMPVTFGYQYQYFGTRSPGIC